MNQLAEHSTDYTPRTETSVQRICWICHRASGVHVARRHQTLQNWQCKPVGVPTKPPILRQCPNRWGRTQFRTINNGVADDMHHGNWVSEGARVGRYAPRVVAGVRSVGTGTLGWTHWGDFNWLCKLHYTTWNMRESGNKHLCSTS